MRGGAPRRRSDTHNCTDPAAAEPGMLARGPPRL